GGSVPLDLAFSDERGNAVRLRDEIDRPVILTLVYFECEHICPQVLGGLAEALGKIDLTPRKDYKVFTLSFDDADTPETAMRARSNYVEAVGKSFPDGAWKFLTGDHESIKRITSDLGFTFRKEAHGFIHPVVLVILSPEGKITRYISVAKYQYGVAYRVTFSPIELAASIREASQGRIGVSSTRSDLFCFPEEPKEQAAFFRLLGIVGTVTLLGMVGLFVYLRRSTKKTHKER
ncbi:MAG: SCO family protein, partial [Chloroflexota bacterium]